MKELKRVLFDRTTVFMLILLTAVGSVLFLLSVTSSAIGKGYNAVYDKRYHEMLEEYKDFGDVESAESALTAQKAFSNMANNIAFHLNRFGEDEGFNELLAEYPEMAEAYREGRLQPYIDNVFLGQAERELCDVILEQIKYVSEFNNYYPTIKKNAERMKHTSIFGDPNSFAYRNTMKTVEDFASIDGAVAELGDDRAITSVFSDNICDYLILLFMAAVSLVMLKERKSGLWQLVRATSGGRSKLALWRMAALLAASLIAALFIFGSRVLIAYQRYDGWKYGARLIQSVPGFNGITVPMSANRFMAIYFAVKFICTFGAGLLLYLLLSAVKNTNIAIAITALVLASEFTLFSAVRDSSILVPFKYINIFQLIEPRSFTVNYLNLNIFERPLNVRAAVASVMALLALLAAIGILLIHLYKRPGGKPNPLEKLIDAVRRLTYRCVFMQETGKVLIFQRCIVIFAVLVFVFISFGKLPEPTVTTEQTSAMKYYRKYAGSVSEETLVSLNADAEEVRAAMEASDDSFYRMILQNTLNGIDRLKLDVEDIIERNASGEYGKEILLLPPFTYMIVFGENSREFQTGQGLKALLCICLMSAGLFAYERQSSMAPLLRSLPGGREKLFRRKQMLMLVFSAFVFAAVYLPEIIAEADGAFYEGFKYFGFPIQGLDICREWKLQISVGAMTVILYIIRFAFIFMTCQIVGLLSSLSQRVNTAMVLVCSVLVVPACITAMGVTELFRFTPLPALWAAGAVFRREWAPAAVYAAIAVFAWIMNRRINCGSRTSLSSLKAA